MGKTNVTGGSFIKSLQRGQTSVNVTTVNVSITSVDLNKAIVYVTGIDAFGTGLSQTVVRAKLTSSTNLELTINDATNPPDVAWSVIEFNGVKSVQRGDVTDSTGSFQIPISSVNTNKSEVFYSFKSSSIVDLASRTLQSMRLLNSTNIQVDYSFGINRDYHWQVIEFY